MRWRRLDLLRYGRFTGVSIDLPRPEHHPDLHVVFGPNEAGKSTALAAIEDLLFGIHPRSPFDFLHAYAEMRIGGVLQNDREVLEIHRRKGTKDTLLTPEDLPIPAGDRALAPFLAGADRDFMRRMFSLDHERLREGAQEILDARDEIGQMLFSAGAGLTGLRETRMALDSEADGLWARRRAGRRKYYHAEDRLKAARAALREHTVTVAAWRRLEQARDAAGRDYAALEREIEEKAAEQGKLVRIRRVYRDVRRSAELEETIAALGEVKLLPEDSRQILQDAERNDAVAASRIETSRGRLEATREERSKLTFDAGLVLHEHDIEQLHERRITALNARADLPARRAELANAEADLRRLAAELEWETGDIERVPPRIQVNAVRTLLNRRGERLAAAENTGAAAEGAAARVAELQSALRQSAPVDVTKLQAVTRAVRGLGDMGARIGAATVEVVTERATLERLLQSLRPGVADETVLAGLPVPPRETVVTHRDASRELDERRRHCRQRRQDAQRELDRQRTASERLARDEAVVTPDALTRARRHRDAGWSLIRRRYVDAAPVSDAEIGAFAGDGDGSKLPEAYEESVRAVDALADRRLDKAEIAAELTVILRRVAEQRELLASLREEEKTLAGERDRHDAAWRELWAETALEPLPPDDMLEWLSTRHEALGAAQRRSKAERQADELRRQEAEARDGVLGALVSLDAGTSISALGDQPLAVVLEAAREVLDRCERSAERRRELDRAYREATTDEAHRRKARQKADAAWSEWRSQWANALAALGFDPMAEPGTIAARLDVIDEMRDHITRIDDLRHERIGKIEEYVAAFAQDVMELAATVAPDLARLDPEQAALRMEHRLDEAKRARDLREEKDKTITRLQCEIDEHETARRQARADVDRLQREAGAVDGAQLETAIADSNRLRAARAEQGRVLDALCEIGDGLSVEALREECEGVDVDQMQARETSLAQELEDLRERLLEARERRTAARKAFEAVGGDDDKAARAAADRQEALAEMRDIAEQYVRARSAALLLQWAIDRYRIEKQAPLLRSAGELFALLTGGSFESLRINFDDQDRAHLVGVRRDGAEVAIPGMSTGTADQLYLALRIGSVEDYLERADPLPFIADDLFINFDDERAAAGIQALGRLATRTQVLFFTHHRHLVDIVRATLGETVPVVELGEMAGA